ncbi:MAG: helix-turn-helix domain-containing protein [Actinobacteria bacterium]|nr:helix-turn-helix domain-containing protein [Actinomycetota bacterium]
MTTLLTTRDVQALIKVDKSTIYRMAESGRLPAIKVGRQWRFPEDEVLAWLGRRGGTVESGGGLRSLAGNGTMQAVADVAGEVLGVMVVITDMEGRPLSEVVNPCGLFGVVHRPDTVERCIAGWREYGQLIDLTPRFAPSHLGFLCARSFVRVGSSLEGMVIAGGIAPDEWPPPAERIDRLAEGLGMDAAELVASIDGVYRVGAAERERILTLLPSLATLLSHLASERGRLVETLEAIASLAGPASTRSTT